MHVHAYSFPTEFPIVVLWRSAIPKSPDMVGVLLQQKSFTGMDLRLSYRYTLVQQKSENRESIDRLSDGSLPNDASSSPFCALLTMQHKNFSDDMGPLFPDDNLGKCTPETHLCRVQMQSHCNFYRTCFASAMANPKIMLSSIFRNFRHLLGSALPRSKTQNELR